MRHFSTLDCMPISLLNWMVSNKKRNLFSSLAYNSILSIYEMRSKSRVSFYFHHVAPLKVIALRYNIFPILDSLLTKCYWCSLEFFRRCSFYLLNLCCGMEKSRGQIRTIHIIQQVLRGSFTFPISSATSLILIR